MGTIKEAHNVRVLGSGEQVVMVCHGFGTDQSVWKHLIAQLVHDYRVISYDHMGCGTTNPEYFDFERYSTIEGYVLDVLAILEDLQVKSCIFIGHSVKAMAGAIASISRPDMFSKLITIDATPRLINDVDYIGGFEQKDMDELLEGMTANYEAWCSGFAPLVVGSDMSSEAVREFSRTLFNMQPDIALCVARALFLSDLRHLLPSVKTPTHILHSKNDTVVPVSVSEYLHRNLGGESVVEILPTTGHLPQLSSPAIVVPAVLRHIRCSVSDLVSDH